MKPLAENQRVNVIVFRDVLLGRAGDAGSSRPTLCPPENHEGCGRRPEPVERPTDVWFIGGTALPLRELYVFNDTAQLFIALDFFNGKPFTVLLGGPAECA